MDSKERKSGPDIDSQVGAVGGGGEPDEKNKKGKTLAEVLPMYFPKGRLIPLDGVQFKVSEIDSDECEILLKGTGFTKRMQRQGAKWGLSKAASDDPELTRQELLTMFGEVYDRYAQAFGMMSETYVTQAVEMLQNNTTASIAAVVEQMERKLGTGIVEILDLAGTSVKVYRGEAEAERREIDSLSHNVNLLREQLRILAEFLQVQFSHVEIVDRSRITPGVATSPDEIERREVEALKAAIRENPRVLSDDAALRNVAPRLAGRVLAHDPETLMRLMDPHEHTAGQVSNDLIPKALVPAPLVGKDASGVFKIYWPGSDCEMTGFTAYEMALQFWPGARPDDELRKSIEGEFLASRIAVVQSLKLTIKERNEALDNPITHDDIELAVFGTNEEMSDERRREMISFIGSDVVAKAIEMFEADPPEASPVAASPNALTLTKEIFNYLSLTEYFTEQQALDLAAGVAVELGRDTGESGIPQPRIEQEIRKTGAAISDELIRRLALNLVGRFQGGTVSAMHGAGPSNESARDRIRAAIERGDLKESDIVSSGHIDLMNESAITLVQGKPDDELVGHPESETAEFSEFNSKAEG